MSETTFTALKGEGWREGGKKEATNLWASKEGKETCEKYNPGVGLSGGQRGAGQEPLDIYRVLGRRIPTGGLKTVPWDPLRQFESQVLGGHQ